MEKLNSIFSLIKFKINKTCEYIKKIFIQKHTDMTDKNDFDFRNISILFFSLMSIFMILGLFMPSNDERVFRQIAKDTQIRNQEAQSETENKDSTSAAKIWGNGRSSSYKGYSSGGQTHSINYNTSMVIQDGKGNSKYELPAGTRFKIQILEKFMASQDGTPVIAKLLESVTSASGNEIPEGSLLYGEGLYQKASEKAVITFKQVSYPDGSQHAISAKAFGDDGLIGFSGNVKSNSVKNSMGQVITNFVGSMAQGSVERDFLGNSKGGTSNGLYQAVADAAKDRAQKIGEELKESREWIEVDAGSVGEAILQTQYKLMNLDYTHGGENE